MDVVCDRCGWRVTPGQFIEANITPDLMSALPEDWTIGYLEAEHFLMSGCRGSVVRVARRPTLAIANGWTYLPHTGQYERHDGQRVTVEHVRYYGWPHP